MLIGPTITLAELENHLKAKKIENQKTLEKVKREIEKTREMYVTTSKYITDDQGESVPNPKFIEINDKKRKLETQFNNLLDQLEFVDQKLTELRELDENSRYPIDKTKEKITLTLNDCLLIGYTTGEKQ